MEDKKIKELWDYLIKNNIEEEKTIVMITGIYGYNLENLENILYYKTGYRDLKQITEEE